MSVPASVVVPGNHDGVHLGHQSLIRRAREHVGPSGRVVALTFWPHPLALLRPERAPEAITTVTRRLELLRRAGADDAVVATFDAEYAAQSATAWARDRLIRDLGASAIVIGPDYRFGKDRQGTPELLRSLGLSVLEASSVEIDGARVSSTRVRDALRAGDVTLASSLLGRVHDVEGVVVRGDGRGRTIGVPTANLGALGGMLPRDGVYAVVAEVDGELLRGVANLGTRPTFGAGRSLEAHFFDVDRDLYDRPLRLGFVERLRDEQKFDGVASLVAQIRADLARGRQVLESADRSRWSWLSSNALPAKAGASNAQ